MSNKSILFGLCLSVLMVLGANLDLLAQKNGRKPLAKTFNSAAKPPSPRTGGKPRLEMHLKPKPLPGVSSRASIKQPPPVNRYAPRKPTTGSGQFNAVASPRLRNKFNVKSNQRPSVSSNPIRIRKKFNAAASPSLRKQFNSKAARPKVN